jgi:hypothetical protein
MAEPCLYLERVVALEIKVNNITHDLYSNGQKGFIEETRDYINQQKGIWKAVLGIGVFLAIMQSISTIHILMK